MHLEKIEYIRDKVLARSWKFCKVCFSINMMKLVDVEPQSLFSFYLFNVCFYGGVYRRSSFSWRKHLAAFVILLGFSCTEMNTFYLKTQLQLSQSSGNQQSDFKWLPSMKWRISASLFSKLLKPQEPVWWWTVSCLNGCSGCIQILFLTGGIYDCKVAAIPSTTEPLLLLV